MRVYLHGSGAAEAVRRATLRGRDARARIPPAADAGSRREVEAFDQLCSVWQLLLAARKGRADQVRQG